MAVEGPVAAAPGSEVSVPEHLRGAAPVDLRVTYVSTWEHGPVRMGDYITVRGTASRNLVGKWVRLQLGYAGDGWRTIADLRVEARGRFGADDVRVKRPGRPLLRVLAPATATTQAGSRKAGRIRILRHESWIWSGWSASHVAVGEPVTFTGTTTGNLIGRPVLVQRKLGSTWATVARGEVIDRGVVTQAGGYSVTVPSVTGPVGLGQQFRVFINGTVRVEAASEEYDIGVHQPVKLTDDRFALELTGAGWRRGSASVAGTTHHDVWLVDRAVDQGLHLLRFVNHRNCLGFRFTVAPVDDAPAEAETAVLAWYDVDDGSAGSQYAWEGTITAATPKSLRWRISNAAYGPTRAVVRVGPGEATLALIDAEVVCPF